MEYTRIGILSDTHDNIPRIKDAVTRLNKEGVDLVLHAGDYIAPFVMGTLKDLNAEMIGVFGNNDGDRDLLVKKCADFPHLSIPGIICQDPNRADDRRDRPWV